MASIQITNVSKHFGQFTAVNDLSLDIGEGEFMALLGPSGCGKTTTMNMIAGIEDASEGEILFDGKDLSAVSIQDRNIGFVFQNYAIFTHLSVFQNLAFGLEVKRVSKVDIERRVQAMAKRMSIEHRLGQRASSLSVNEMQKLAIGRSAIVEPRVFLLDEPLSNLDAGFRAYMRAELKILQREFGQTMIYVTHDQIEAMSLADRIAIMNAGELMQCGAPLEIYNDPSSRFVASFVGSPRINLINGELRRSSGRCSLVAEGGAEFTLSGRIVEDVRASYGISHVTIGIRPHDIYFGERRSDDDIGLPAKVSFVEHVGARRHAYFDVQGTMVIAEDEHARLSAGESVTFYLSTDKCLAFDLESGRRLRRHSR